MKKLISLVLTLILLVTATGASASDLENLNIEQAIETLENLKVIEGYEKGAFNSTEEITRGEAFKIIFNFYPPEYEDAGTAQESEVFSDITKEHSSRNAVTMFGLLGIVLGDGDGNVRPDENILTEELVTLIVKVLGYNETVTVAEGGFPNGYMQIAEEIGLLKGVGKIAGEYADKQTFAQMVYNAIEIPKMVFSQYDASTFAPIYKIDENQNYRKDILGYNRVPSRVLTLPGKTGSFYYKFGIMDEQYSEYLINITEVDTGIRMKFNSTTEDHTVNFELIDEDTGAIIYNTTLSVFKDFQQELYLPCEYFTKLHDYYIKLTSTSVKDAGGIFVISE